MLIIVTGVACTSLVICTISMIIYKSSHNNILIRLGKSLSYNDQFMDSTALRTGTYTVDHLKLANIVGMFFLIKLINNPYLFNITMNKCLILVNLL